MFHFCPEELVMIMSAMPVAGHLWSKLKLKVKCSKKSCPNHKKDKPQQGENNAV